MLSGGESSSYPALLFEARTIHYVSVIATCQDGTIFVLLAVHRHPLFLAGVICFKYLLVTPLLV